MATYAIFNGRLIQSGDAIIGADNRGLRYGDGMFETMKVWNSEIMLASYHFERLFDGMMLMQFDVPDWFTVNYLHEQVISLCTKNGHQQKARVRLMVFRGKGGLYNPENLAPNFVIQTWQLQDDECRFSGSGLKIGVYPLARKSVDSFSHLKSNNYLPYLMAALHAVKHQLEDCLVLNSVGNICESTVANIFVIKDKKVLTPALSEGCVAGVMRRNLLQKLPDLGFHVQEVQLAFSDLASADEIFLSNAVYGVRWVRQLENTEYGHSATQAIYNGVCRNAQ